MKKITKIIFCLTLLSGLSGCSSQSNVPTPSSNNKTSQADEGEVKSDKKENKENEQKVKEVLLNENGIYVEYRGVKEYSSDSWIINLYIENNKDTEFCMALRDVVADGYSIGIANNSPTIQPGTKFLADPQFKYVLDTEDLKAYEMTKLNTLECNLWIGTSMLGDTIIEKPITLTINKDIE